MRDASAARHAWLLRIVGRAALLGLFVGTWSGCAAAVAQEAPVWPELRVVLEALERNYLGDIDEAALLDGAIAGMVAALDDPFTEYVPARDTLVLNATRSGSFGGIGANFGKREGEPAEVTRVYYDLPAHTAGLAVGDRVLEVDGRDVADLDLTGTIDIIRGPVGEAVTLRVVRPGLDGSLLISVVREMVTVPTVTATVLRGDVGYLRIETFENRQVLDQVREHLAAFERQEVGGLILDLRGNGGGYLAQGVAVADAFLSHGPILYTRAQGVTRLAASADAHASELPLVVIIDSGSASASEIVAAALQDHHRATIVGERSFGKGVGQDLLPLPGGGELKYVTFEWLRPSRASVHERGVEPDIVVPSPAATIRTVGTGAPPGAEVELEVDGVPVARAVADAEVAFALGAPVEPASGVARLGVADVDPATDPALRTALELIGPSVRAAQ